MDVYQFHAMTQQTCQEFAQKMAVAALTEYEMQMYESACRALAEFFKIQQVNYEMELKEFYKKNPKWGYDDESGDTSRPTA